MVHTATMSYCPSKERYKNFISRDDVRWHKQDKKNICNTFADKGIIISAYEVKNIGFYCYYFSIRINFKRLIESENHVLIYSDEDAEKVEEQFNVIAMATGLPVLTEWKIKRIDYCFNCTTPYVKEYIHLLQKGDFAQYHHVPFNAQRNYSKREGSCYLAGKSTTINFYDKQDQLIKESKDNPSITEQMIKDAENVLRIEVQCHAPKTSYERDKYGLNGKYIGYFMNYEIAIEILINAIKELRSIQDYVKKKKALKIIRESRHQKKTKDFMEKVINEVAKQHSSIKKVKEKLQEDGISPDKINTTIRQIENLGINVVTIPRDWKIKNLKSIYDLVEESYIAEMDL